MFYISNKINLTKMNEHTHWYLRVSAIAPATIMKKLYTTNTHVHNNEM